MPDEACALILADGRLHLTPNISRRPQDCFRIDPKAVIYASQVGIAAVLHSHIGKNGASGADRTGRKASGVPWVIVNLSVPDGKLYDIQMLP